MQNQLQVQTIQTQLKRQQQGTTLRFIEKQFKTKNIQILFFQEKPITLPESSLVLQKNKNSTQIILKSKLGAGNLKVDTTLHIVVHYEDILCLCKNKGQIMIMIKGEEQEWNQDSDQSQQQIEKVNPTYQKITKIIRQTYLQNQQQKTSNLQTESSIVQNSQTKQITLKLSAKCNITITPLEFTQENKHEVETIYKQLQAQLDSYQKQIQIQNNINKQNNNELLGGIEQMVNLEDLNMMDLNFDDLNEQQMNALQDIQNENYDMEQEQDFSQKQK